MPTHIDLSCTSPVRLLLTFSRYTACVPHPRGPRYRKTFKHVWVMYVVVREKGKESWRESEVKRAFCLKPTTLDNKGQGVPHGDDEKYASITSTNETRQTRTIFNSSPDATLVNNAASFCVLSFPLGFNQGWEKKVLSRFVNLAILEGEQTKLRVIRILMKVILRKRKVQNKLLNW